MAECYDMCVDYDILCGVEDKLQNIEYDLNNSAIQMVKAIQVSQDFLAGNQFEKAKRTTFLCIESTRRTGSNIRHAMDYITKLKSALDEYGKCGYSGEGHNEGYRFGFVKE